MSAAFAPSDAPGSGTEVVRVHAGLQPGIDPRWNAAGWRMAPARLAAPVEAEIAAGRA
jgi:hypothetical protein